MYVTTEMKLRLRSVKYCGGWKNEGIISEGIIKFDRRSELNRGGKIKCGSVDNRRGRAYYAAVGGKRER